MGKPKMPTSEAMLEGIRDCVRKIATVGEDHQRGSLLAGGVAALCSVLRKMEIPHSDLGKISSVLKEIRSMPEGTQLWKAYEKSGQDPIAYTIDDLRQRAEGGS